MILHHNTLISLDIIQKKFICNFDTCQGACCVEGDYGAPLDDNEIIALQDNIYAVMEFMSPEALQLLNKGSFFEKDPFYINVTKCVGNADCIFCYKEGKMARCAIEKAYTENKIDFRKPLSCHLYPIRVSRIESYEALNYHEWEICETAKLLGNKLGMPLYRFLKEPMIRKYGKAWYKELEEIVEEFNREGTGI
jgi:hypothetical protein